jgi:hypothetical protein
VKKLKGYICLIFSQPMVVKTEEEYGTVVIGEIERR